MTLVAEEATLRVDFTKLLNLFRTASNLGHVLGQATRSIVGIRMGPAVGRLCNLLASVACLNTAIPHDAKGRRAANVAD